MAKQSSIYQFKGKLGNAVGFSNKDAKVSGSSFVRRAPATVSNPKSYDQAAQRAKVTPAANFYAAFESVLNHAFIPNGSKGKNRQQFMKHAMKLDLIPDVLKGEAVLPCLPYQISKGNVGLDHFTKLAVVNTNNVASHIVSGLKLPAEISSQDVTDPANVLDLTVGELSSVLIDNNLGLVEGMEITFLAVVIDEPAERTKRYSVRGSMVLNRNDDVTTVFDVLPPQLKICSKDGKLATMLKDIDANHVRSFGIIISSKSGDTYKYTTSFMLDSPLDIDGAVTVDEVVASYQASASTTSSDLILQQANNSASGVVLYVSFDNVPEVTLSHAVAGATLNHNQAGLAKNSLGESKLIVGSDGQLMYYLGNNQVEGITKTVDTVVTPVLISETTLAGNPTVTVAELGF